MENRINLSTFAGGAVIERFDKEMVRVLENLLDPNTDPKKSRKLTLTIALKGDDKRDIAEVDIQAKVALAPAKSISSRIVMGRDTTGKIVGSELKSGIKGQTFIDPDGDVAEDTGDKVVDYRKRREN